MTYALGIDVGTEGTKVLAIDRDGNIAYRAYSSYTFDVPQAGWTEQDPAVWWDALVTCLRDLWLQGLQASDVKGIGIAGQMHSSVLLDADGQVVRKSILWNDTRTKRICDEVLHSIGASTYQSETCNSLLPGFTLGKILWVRENEPETYERIGSVLMPKDYINYRLTGRLSADVSDASGTGVFDVRCRQWHDDLIGRLGLVRSWFPPVHESGDVIGAVSEAVASATGLQSGTPVVAGAADNAAAALGMGIVTTNRGLVSVGTSGVALACFTTPPDEAAAARQNPTLHVFCHAVPNLWYGMGVTLSAGASLRWFRDGLGAGSNYDELMAEAALVEAGSQGMTFFPFLTGERTPYNSDKLRGGFLGLSLQHKRGHFARSVIEGVAYSLRDCVELISGVAPDVKEMLLTGGVTNSPLWSQVLSDVLGTPLVLETYSEGAGYGAGLLAGAASGFWSDVTDVVRQGADRRRYLPSANRDRYNDGYHEYKRQADALLALATLA